MVETGVGSGAAKRHADYSMESSKRCESLIGRRCIVLLDAVVTRL